MAGKLIVPLYIYPTVGTAWADIAANPTGIEYVIVNDRNGSLDGQSADANYTSGIASLRAANIKLLFYVDTNFGTIATTTVEANMDAWISLYGAPDGWFLDRSPSGAGDVTYLSTLYTYANGKYVVTNYGTFPDESHFSTAGVNDTGVLLENTAASVESANYPAWLSTYPSNRYAVFAYSSTDLNTTWSAIPTAVKYRYITDAANYTVLPTWFDAEQRLAGRRPYGTGIPVYAYIRIDERSRLRY